MSGQNILTLGIPPVHAEQTAVHRKNELPKNMIFFILKGCTYIFGFSHASVAVKAILQVII